MKKGKEKFKLNKITSLISLTLVFGLSLVLFIYSLNISFPAIRNVALEPLSPVKAQTTSLYLTNIHISSLTSSSVTIAWETNLLADSEVKIGKTTNYELNCLTCSSDDLVKTHRITIGNLEPVTTYHYQVISTSQDGERKTSLDRTFTTSSASGDSEAPGITGVSIDATDTSADVTVNTTEDSHITFYYSADGVNWSSYAEQAADPYVIIHEFTISGLTRDTVYRYYITVFDQSGNSFTTGEFQFQTAATAGDRIFTTGQCEGGIQLRGCSADGYYCDPGTATLIRYCGQCGYSCPSGQTCQPDGVCTADPILTGDPYQCNAESCYRSCSVGTSRSCTVDSDCPICVGGDRNGQACSRNEDCTNGGLCSGVAQCVDDGIFNSPAPAGCYSSYPRCDANVILKVKRDRECAKWLTCGTGIEQTDPTSGQVEELCMDLAACTALGENNQCSSYVDLPKSEEETTFRTPDQIEQIQWLTGSVIAGLDWQYQEASPIIKGYFPWSAMEEVGEKLEIENNDFESTKIDSEDDDEDGNIVELIYTHDPWTKYPNTSENPTFISTDWEPGFKDQKENRVLEVEQMSNFNQGVQGKIDGSTNSSSKYILSLRIKSSSSEEQRVTLRLSSGGESPRINTFGEYSLTTGWQEIQTLPMDGVGGSDAYINIYVSGGNRQPFYIDDVYIWPVLEVQSGVYLERSCRLYPKEDSPYCEYYDDNGIYNKGWYGYCLERDPKNENLCISWWPVDLLYGESNIFGLEEQAGYTGREPLYYCLESWGLGDRNYHINTQCSPAGTDFSCSPNCNINFVGAFCRRQLQSYGERPLENETNLYSYRPVGLNLWRPDNLGGAEFADWANPSTNDEAEENVRKLFHRDNIRKATIQWDVYLADGSHWNDIGEILRENNFSWQIYSNNNQAWSLRCSNEHINNLYNSDWGDTSSYGYTCLRRQSCCNGGQGWLAGVQLDFDEHNMLNGFYYGLYLDDLGGDVGAYFHVRGIDFYLKEPCDKVVQVVQSGGENMAWADTINSQGYKVSDLNYGLMTDFSPYGGAVTAGGDDPTQWTRLLFAEEKDDTNFTSPFQERSGKPYACVGNCSKRFCWGGNNNGEACLTHGDCVDNKATNPQQGICMGVGVCAEKVNNLITNCTSDSNCCPSLPCENYCLGGAASNRGSQSVRIWPFANDNLYFAQQRIRSLFAKSYGIYEWDAVNSQYILMPGSKDSLTSLSDTPVWGPPNLTCSGGTRPDYKPDNATTYCGIAPKVRNIKLGDGTSNVVKLGKDGGKVRLSFNSIVDRQQEPLKRIYIDWGDGTPIQTPPANYKSKDDPNNPHVYTHSYARGACADNDNRCKIKILIEDNWEWCSNHPNQGVQYFGVCTGEDRLCRYDFDCVGVGTCDLSRTYTCDLSSKSIWDPVDTCRPIVIFGVSFEGNCIDGICSGGLDSGRPCGSLIVDLSK